MFSAAFVLAISEVEKGEEFRDESHMCKTKVVSVRAVYMPNKNLKTATLSRDIFI